MTKNADMTVGALAEVTAAWSGTPACFLKLKSVQ